MFKAASAAWLCSVLGCGVATRRQTFVEPGSAREYTVVSRADHDPKRPARVLFSLHPYGNEPELLVESYRLVHHAVKERGWILVVPRGERDEMGLRYWNASAACCGFGARKDDRAYLRGVLADVRKRFAIDAASVSAIGVSNGSFMAQRWACDPVGELRVIVSIAGAGPGAEDPPCTPSVPVSVLHIHGDADDSVLYRGGTGDPQRLGQSGPYPSAPETVRAWLHVGSGAAASASARPQVTRTRTWSLSVVRREEHSLPGRSVRLWTVEGGDHGLPVLRRMVGEIFAFMDSAVPQRQ